MTKFLDDDNFKIGIAVIQNVIKIKSVIALDTSNYLTFCNQPYCSNVSIETKNNSQSRGTIISAMCLTCYSMKQQNDRKLHRNFNEKSNKKN